MADASSDTQQTPEATPVIVVAPAPTPPIGVPKSPVVERRWYTCVADFFWRYFSGMFLEQKEGTNVWAISLGRVTTVALIIQAMWCWHSRVELLETQKSILFLMVGYIFGGKTLTAAKSIVAAVKGVVVP